jgi:hypothetical protein
MFHSKIRVKPILIVVTTLSSLSFAGFAYPEPSFSGSAPGVISCKAIARGRGPISIEGQIPGDYEIFDLKIKSLDDEHLLKSLNTIDRDIDPAERTKLEEAGVIANDRSIMIVEDFNRGIFTLALRRAEGYDLRLYALPATIRVQIKPNSKKASFDAMVLEGDNRKAIRMRCRFDHSI